jgi:hypothetical protein
MELCKITMEDVIGNLPDIQRANISKVFEGNQYDLFIQAVGFEQRTLAVSEKLATLKNFSVKETILIRYTTNIEDNLFYELDLKENVAAFSKKVSSFTLDSEFVELFKQKINSSFSGNGKIKIIVDFSSFSSRIILALTRIFFQSDIDLSILYAEGDVYHPTEEEYEKLIKQRNADVKLSQTFGIDSVIISEEYNGGAKEHQDIVICFPSFKSERTEAIVSNIDDLILKEGDRKRLIWIVGDPHMGEPQKQNRKEIQVKMNNIKEQDKRYYVSTLDYKATLKVLDHIYGEVFDKFHINISDLGSKMQSFGIALFATLRRDISVYYSEPIKYNPSHYADGVKDIWTIHVANTLTLIKQLFRVDTLELKNSENR